MSKQRFYKNELPEIGEVTMIEVMDINEYGITVKLLEYAEIDGMINLRELSHKRTPVVHIGKVEPACVTTIDKNHDKIYVDLSRKNLTDKEKEECKNRYVEAKLLNNILRSSSNELTKPINELYEQLIWNKEINLTVLRTIATKEKKIIDIFGDLDAKLCASLEKNINSRIKIDQVKLSAGFNLLINNIDAVNIIKNILITAKKEFPLLTVEISGGNPYYIVYTKLRKDDIEHGFEELKKFLKVIEEKTKEKNGNFESKGDIIVNY